MTDRADRFCASCGRRITWRAKWARDWENVRYCSDACRRRGIRPVDRRLQEVLAERIRSGRAVPIDQVARDVAADSEETEAELAEPARRAARRLVADGEAEIVQRGRVVDASTARGPFEVRRRR